MQQNPWMGAQKPPMGRPSMGQPPRIGVGKGGPLSQTQLIQLYLEEGMSMEEATAAASASSNLPWDVLTKAEGGRIELAGGGMGRRAFMKIMAGLAATPFIGRGIKKAIPEAAKVTEEVIKRGPDGMPTYITDLIEVVKAKGIKKIVDSDINKYPDTLHSYKGVDVTEDSLGNIKIKNDRSGMATDSTTGKTHEGIVEEHHMQIERGQMNVKDEGLETQKGFQEPDEYIEGTVRPDMDGKMKDFEEGLDEDVHEFFKKIADEGSFLTQKRNRVIKSKKASGGLAYALGE